MTEVNHIPNTTEVQEPRASLTAHLESLLGAALGGNDDPDQALRIMTAALQERTELPKLQRRVAELEAALAAETARIPPLEVEAQRGRLFSTMVSREHNGSENPDELIGFTMAAIESHKQLPALIDRFNAQTKELATLKASYEPFERVMTMISASLGRAGSFEEMYRVTEEALEARSEREANKLRMVEVERENDLRKLEGLISKGKTECRLTAFMESNVRHAFAAGTITLETISFMVDTMPRIAALERKAECSPIDALAHLKHDGKAWAQLKPAQRAALAKEDPETYRAMRDAAAAEGKVY